MAALASGRSPPASGYASVRRPGLWLQRSHTPVPMYKRDKEGEVVFEFHQDCLQSNERLCQSTYAVSCLLSLPCVNRTSNRGVGGVDVTQFGSNEKAVFTAGHDDCSRSCRRSDRSTLWEPAEESGRSVGNLETLTMLTNCLGDKFGLSAAWWRGGPRARHSCGN